MKLDYEFPDGFNPIARDLVEKLLVSVMTGYCKWLIFREIFISSPNLLHIFTTTLLQGSWINVGCHRPVIIGCDNRNLVTDPW